MIDRLKMNSRTYEWFETVIPQGESTPWLALIGVPVFGDERFLPDGLILVSGTDVGEDKMMIVKELWNADAD